MKKLMTTLAASLVATAIMADVTSQNMVGYVEKTIHPGFNMIAFNWDLVNDPGTGISVQDIFDTSKLNGGLTGVTADTINIHDAATGGYETLFLYDGTGTSYTENNGLWLESDRSPSTRDVKSGYSFWLISRASGTVKVNMAGQVPTANEARTVLPGFNMFGSGYSADFKVNSNFDWLAAGAQGGLTGVTADTINIHDAETGGYTTLFLYDGTGTSYTTDDGKWLESDRTVSTRTIPAGSGFWYISRGTDAAGWEWAEAKPYNLD